LHINAFLDANFEIIAMFKMAAFCLSAFAENRESELSDECEVFFRFGGFCSDEAKEKKPLA